MKGKLILTFFMVLCSVQLVSAQYTKLFDFHKGNDLRFPSYSKPVFDGTWLYDVTRYGGKNNYGAIYKVKPDGSGYTKLFDFTATATDASEPYGSLLLKGDTLFGTAAQGGSKNKGCIFRIKTDGTQFARVVDFTGTTGDAMGSTPRGGLTLIRDTLYGMTREGGATDYGVIFKVKTNGTGYTVLKNLTTGVTGIIAESSLIQYGDTLFGLTKQGGTYGYGCLFKITTKGVYTNLLNMNWTDTQGYYPIGSPAIANGRIYCTTNTGGVTRSVGTIFSVKLDGSGKKIIAEFGAPYGQGPNGSLTADSKGNLYGSTNFTFGSEVIFKITPGDTYTEILKFNGVNGRTPLGQLALLNDSVLVGTTTGDNGNISNGGLFRVNIQGKNYRQILPFSAYIDGSNPLYGSLTAYGDTLFGVTPAGGEHFNGVLYKIIPNGTFVKVYDFDGFRGGKPKSGLTLAGKVLYGLTTSGGKFNYGCVFKINPDGTGYDSIYSFRSSFFSYSAPVVTHDTIIFSCNTGGSNTAGEISMVRTNGTGYTTLHTFDSKDLKGSNPAGIALSGYTIYGSAINGGSNNRGCLFKMHVSGTGYDNFYNFNTSDGAYPYGAVTISGNVIYGTTKDGGSYYGNVFKLNTDGSGFTNLRSFIQSNGSAPFDGVCLVGDKLYGLNSYYAQNFIGSMFSLNTDGTNFQKVFDFDGTTKGSTPDGGLTFAGNALYGATFQGGTDNLGVVFKYQLTKSDPLLTWANPNDINVGNALGAAQLNATANVPGTFVYTPAAGTVLSAGNNQTLSVVFTPNDASSYNVVSKSVIINVIPQVVQKITPVITWNNPADITYGTQLTNTQLNATTNVPGTFTYTPASGTVLSVGDGQTLSVTFTPNDLTAYNTANKSVLINVLPQVASKITPTITWNNPANIVYGTQLSNTQLNATANVPGTFTYTPVVGTLLNIGNNQSLQVHFEPSDNTLYTPADKTVYINVLAVTGEQNLQRDLARVFPVPAADKITIESKTSFHSIYIVKIDGSIVIEYQTGETNNTTISVKDVEPGRYILLVKDKNNSVLSSRQIIIVR